MSRGGGGGGGAQFVDIQRSLCTTWGRLVHLGWTAID